MQDYYAARAKEYDAVYAKPERQSDLRQIEAWLPKVLANRAVLEVACGTGYWTRFFATAAKQVVAIDYAPETLQVARGRVPADKVMFVVGDAYHLPLLPRSFEACFAGFWWSHVPRQRIREFLLALHAVLLPGSRVVFLDNRYVAGSSTPVADRDIDGNTYQMRQLADGSRHRVLKNFPSGDEVLEDLAPAAQHMQFLQWQHYWAVEYTLAV